METKNPCAPKTTPLTAAMMAAVSPALSVALPTGTSTPGNSAKETGINIPCSPDVVLNSTTNVVITPPGPLAGVITIVEVPSNPMITGTATGGPSVPVSLTVGGTPPAKSPNSPIKKKTNLSTGVIGSSVALTVLCAVNETVPKHDFKNYAS